MGIRHMLSAADDVANQVFDMFDDVVQEVGTSWK